MNFSNGTHDFLFHILVADGFKTSVTNTFFIRTFWIMFIFKIYSIAGISITQDEPRRGCPVEIYLLCVHACVYKTHTLTHTHTHARARARARTHARTYKRCKSDRAISVQFSLDKLQECEIKSKVFYLKVKNLK